MSRDSSRKQTRMTQGKPGGVPGKAPVAPPRKTGRPLKGEYMGECNYTPPQRRMADMIRALSSGNALAIERKKKAHGDECYTEAKRIWENIDSRQVELRAYCEGALVDLIDTSAKDEVVLKAAVDLLGAIDKANQLKGKFDELSDPEIRKTTIHELRYPTPAAIDVIAAAWEVRVPDAIAKHLASLGWVAP